MISNPVKFISLVVMVLFTSSCAMISAAPETYRKTALQFSPPANKAYIFVMRHYTFGASGAYFAVGLDGVFSGALSNNSFVFYEMDPGEHEIRIWLTTNKITGKKIKNVLASGHSEAAVKINCIGGKCYFFSTSFNAFGDNAYDLRAESEEKGRQFVTKYKMSNMSHKPTEI